MLEQERARNTLEKIGIDNAFLNRTKKRDYMKLKGFFTTKEMVTILKRQPTDWEKIFASYTSDKELINRMNRELRKLNSPKLMTQ
jgi:hypothetical protein